MDNSMHSAADEELGRYRCGEDIGSRGRVTTRG